VVSFTPRPLYPQGKRHWYPLGRRLVGPKAVLDAVMKRKIPNFYVLFQGEYQDKGKVNKVKLRLYLTKNDTMKTYLLLN
jgi:hypothetical protein